MDGTRTEKSTGKREVASGPETKSGHAVERLACRNVSPEQLGYVLQHGDRIRRTGVTFVFLRRRDIPPDDRRRDCYAKLEGVTALVAGDGTLITIWRNRDGLPTIRKKMKYRQPHLAGRRKRHRHRRPPAGDLDRETS